MRTLNSIKRKFCDGFSINLSKSIPYYFEDKKIRGGREGSAISFNYNSKEIHLEHIPPTQNNKPNSEKLKLVQ